MQAPVLTLKARRHKPMPDIDGAAEYSASAAGGATPNKVRFGDAVITTKKLTKAELKRNVDASTAALARANDKIVSAGIRLHPRKDIPLFFADTENPGGFIRNLNGRLQRGVLENGQFKIID